MCPERKNSQEDQRERGERGEGSHCKTERGADRSRLGRAKNVSQFSWRNFNCPGGAAYRPRAVINTTAAIKRKRGTPSRAAGRRGCRGAETPGITTVCWEFWEWTEMIAAPCCAVNSGDLRLTELQWVAGLKRHQTLLLLRCYMKRGSFLEYFTHVPDVQSSFSKKQSKSLKIWSFVRWKRAAFTEPSQCLKE